MHDGGEPGQTAMWAEGEWPAPAPEPPAREPAPKPPARFQPVNRQQGDGATPAA